MREILEQEPLEQLLPVFHSAIWWTGIQPLFQRLVGADLTMAETIVLHSLQRRSMSVAEAATCLCISQSAASRAIDRLVRDGYVARHEDPEDRRQKLLTLTTAGSTLLDDLEGILAQGVQPLLSPLDEEQRQQLKILLVRMIASQLAHNGVSELAYGCGALETYKRFPTIADQAIQGHEQGNSVGVVHDSPLPGGVS